MLSTGHHTPQVVFYRGVYFPNKSFPPLLENQFFLEKNIFFWFFFAELGKMNDFSGKLNAFLGVGGDSVV